MARTEKEYLKLTGKGRPPFPNSLAGGASRLYLGKDHLLKVESSYWSERYRRYYFKDIRLLQVTQTRSSLVTTIILLVITLFFAGLAVLIGNSGGVVLGTAAAVFGVITLVKFAMGPSCRVKITTPLGADDLFSLSRMRVATKVLDRIVPHIRNAQETVDPTALAGRLEVEMPAARSSTAIPTLQALLPSIEASPGKKWVAWLFASFLFLHSGLSLWQALQPSTWNFPTALAVIAVAFGLSVALLIRPAPGCSRKISAFFIVYLGLYGLLLYVVMVQLMIADPLKMSRESTIYPALLAQASKQNGFNLFLNLFATTGSGIFALLIAVFVSKTREEKVGIGKTQPPLPPTI